MQVVQLKCPSCGNSLEVEDGLETFFCQYCGHRIILSEQSEHIVKAKVDIEKLKHEERMLQMQMEENRRIREDQDKSFKLYIMVMGTILLGLAIAALIAALMGRL